MKLKYAIPFLGISFVYEDTKDPICAIVATMWHGIYIILLINGLVWWLG